MLSLSVPLRILDGNQGYGCSDPCWYFSCDLCLTNPLHHLFGLQIMCPVDGGTMFDPCFVFSHLLDIHLKHNNLFRINWLGNVVFEWKYDSDKYIPTWFTYPNSDVWKEKYSCFKWLYPFRPSNKLSFMVATLGSSMLDLLLGTHLQWQLIRNLGKYMSLF